MCAMRWSKIIGHGVSYMKLPLVLVPLKTARWFIKLCKSESQIDIFLGPNFRTTSFGVLDVSKKKHMLFAFENLPETMIFHMTSILFS